MPSRSLTLIAFGRGLSIHYKPARNGYGGHHPWSIQVMKHGFETCSNRGIRIAYARTWFWVHHNPFTKAPHSAAAKTTTLFPGTTQ